MANHHIAHERAASVAAVPSGNSCRRQRLDTFVLACICALFAIKFAIYGWFITPLWELPDEPGHASFVEDLRQGDYPELGTAKISDEVARSWLKPGAQPSFNWIAQHPPLYYVLATPASMAAAASGADFDTRMRAIRLVTAIIGGLALLGLGLFIRESTGNATLGVASVLFIGATPMFLHLSSGISHDTLVAATACWSAYFMSRWIRTDSASDALACAFFAGLCTMTKITGLAIAVPLFAMMCLRIAVSRRNTSLLSKASLASSTWLVMFAAISIWMARNIVLFDSPLPDARIFKELDPKEIGFFAYMLEHPVWETVYLNFIAWIGWTGQGKGALNVIAANGVLAQYFSAALLALSLFSLMRLPDSRASGHSHDARVFAGCAAVSALAAFLLPVNALALGTCITIFLAIALPALANAWPMLRGSDDAWQVVACAFIAIVFGLLYYQRTWDGYLDYGAARALHGRYFYAVLPFVGFLLLRHMRNGRMPAVALLLAAAAMPVGEYFYLRQVLPMFGYT